MDREVYDYLTEYGVPRDRALYIASLPDITYDLSAVLALLPMTPTKWGTWRMVPDTVILPPLAGNDMRQIANYLTQTDEGQRTFNKFIAEYEARLAWEDTAEEDRIDFAPSSELWDIGTQYPFDMTAAFVSPFEGLPAGPRAVVAKGMIAAGQAPLRQQITDDYNAARQELLDSDLSRQDKHTALVELEQGRQYLEWQQGWRKGWGALTVGELSDITSEVEATTPLPEPTEEERARAEELEQEEFEFAQKYPEEYEALRVKGQRFRMSPEQLYQEYQRAGGVESFDYWTRLGKPERPIPTAQEAYFRGLPKFEAGATEEYYESAYPSIYREFLTTGGAEGTEAVQATRWEEFLGKYPWLQKYKELPRRERGEYPSRFRPPTRFLKGF